MYGAYVHSQFCTHTNTSMLLTQNGSEHEYTYTYMCCLLESAQVLANCQLQPHIYRHKGGRDEIVPCKLTLADVVVRKI